MEIPGDNLFNFSPKIYKATYDSEALRGSNNPRPWHIVEVIKGFGSKEKTLLDIGCGTCLKTIPLAPCFHKITAIDISQDMIHASEENVAKNNVENISVLYGNSEKLDFLDNSFDIVISILSRWKVSEIHRVLKKDGVAIIENHGGRDKLNLKREFGKDEKGWCGQFMQLTHKDMITCNHNLFAAHFRKVSIKEGSWKCYYTPEGLTELLENTPLVKDFDVEKDTLALDRIYKKYMTERGIKTTQNRLLIIARK